MKNLLLAAICLLSFACAKAQSYSDTAGRIIVTVNPNMSHDSTTCSSSCSIMYFITVDSSFVGDTIKIVDTVYATLLSTAVNTTGANPWTLVMTVTPYNSPQPDYLLSGGAAIFIGPVTKVICDYDTAKYLTNNFVFPVSNPCLYSDVSGTAYIDNNANCIFDSGDVALNGVDIQLAENLSSPGVSTFNLNGYTAPTGIYNFIGDAQLSWMTSYTVSLPPYYPFIFPYSPCFTPYAPFTTLPESAVNFPLQCTSNVDVMCYALSPVDVRLNRSFYIWPYVSNTGCDSESGELTLVLDSRVVYDAAASIYPADTVHGDTLIWNYTNLTNLSGGAYWNDFLSELSLTPDTTVVVGDTLCFSGYTTIPPTDINPLNNSFNFCLPVVYSYDPNMKVVSPKGTGPQGYIPAGPDTLTYSLHFQNTGTSYAMNINIIDTLDSHINAQSLRILGTSASMTPQWLAPGVVMFSYNGIFLPDSSSDFAGSQGEVRFLVALNTALAPGTQIKNTGYIYFDSNPAVVTNTTLNTIALTTETKQVIAPPAVKVYPNPATDNITVENLNGGTITIMNLNGSVVISENVTNNNTTIDVSRLPSGVYILKTVNDTNTTTTKFTKL